jgi:hypothetical protein
VLDRWGVPLALIHNTAAANVHDSKVLEEAPWRTSSRWASRAVADRASARRSSTPTRATRTSPAGGRLSGRGVSSGVSLEVASSPVRGWGGTGGGWGRTAAVWWLKRFRRLKVRYERRDDIHQAFLDIGCALICWRYLQRFC